MPAVSQVVPMLHVADMPRALHFYVEQLGFKKTIHWIDEGRMRWCWLEIGDASIMLQEYRPQLVPKEKTGVGVSLNFMCDDAIAIYRDAVAKGVNAKRPYVGNGLWVTEMTDPDGYFLTFESKTDVEEDTVYSS